MRTKIAILTLVSGVAALVLAQQPKYQPTAPGNPNAPMYPPNDVITTQNVSPQQILTQTISSQNISGQNFVTNNSSSTNWNGKIRHNP